MLYWRHLCRSQRTAKSSRKPHQGIGGLRELAVACENPLANPPGVAVTPAKPFYPATSGPNHPVEQPDLQLGAVSTNDDNPSYETESFESRVKSKPRVSAASRSDDRPIARDAGTIGAPRRPNPATRAPARLGEVQASLEAKKKSPRWRPHEHPVSGHG